MNNDPLRREYEGDIKSGDYHAALLLGGARIEQMALEVEANLTEMRVRSGRLKDLFYQTHVRITDTREEA